MSKRNAVRCLRCDTVIESKHRHDWVQCECGDVYVDGGHDYHRMGFTEDAQWERLGDNDE